MIRKMSGMEVKTPETYDKDGYPMEGGLMDPHLGVINPGLRCKTCGQKMKSCPGHFGSLELVRPVVHSEFGKKLERLMNATCQNCGRILLKEEKLIDYRAMALDGTPVEKKIISKAKIAKKCPHCSTEAGKILLDKPTNFFMNKQRIYPTQIREWVSKIPEDDLKLLGYNPELVRPEWFVLTVLPVPPITIRPSITLESGIKSEDDLTHKLVDIIRINLRLKDNIDAGAPQLIIEDLWDLLQYHVTTYFDNNTAGVPPAKHRSGRALRTIVQRLKGKKGRFRHNLTGKRVNFAARSTVTPDPYISINEVGVPESIANELTVPESVTEWNKEELKKLVEKSGKAVYLIRPNGTRKLISDENRAEVIEEMAVGFRIERKLMDGDIALFNRQPSLHRLSMMAHHVRVMKGKTFKINPIVCKPYNADFDGDEMNLHVPQSEEGKTEARELMLVQNQIISPRYGGPVIILDEDGVSGAFVLTHPSTTFTKKEAMEMFYQIGVKDIPKADKGKNYSGRLIFSQLLPKDLNLEYKTKTGRVLAKIEDLPKELEDKFEEFAIVKIKNGELVSGVVDEESLGEGRGKLIDALARNYPSDIVRDFYDNMNKLTGSILTRRGMTVGLDEYEVSDDIRKEKNKAIEEGLKKGAELLEDFQKGRLEHIPGRTLEESYEIKMMQLAAGIKDRIEKRILREKIGSALSDTPKLDNITMILSGSRGSAMNLMNIAGFWGQASVREGRPKRGYSKRLIPLNKREDVGMIAGGFIKQNFLEGMNPKEFFFHSMGGRQGEVDTGVSTKVSGYLYRRLANSLKDLVVSHDGTVRTAAGNVIQYIYGEDGVFPKNTIRGKNLSVEEDYKIMKLSEKEKK